MEPADDLYLVLLYRNADFDPAVLPQHQAFLDELRASAQIQGAGPFADGSGGAYLLGAASPQQAQAIAARDPAVRSGGWSMSLHAWRMR